MVVTPQWSSGAAAKVGEASKEMLEDFGCRETEQQTRRAMAQIEERAESQHPVSASDYDEDESVIFDTLVIPEEISLEITMVQMWINDKKTFNGTRGGYKSAASRARKELECMNLDEEVSEQDRAKVQKLLNTIYHSYNYLWQMRESYLTEIKGSQEYNLNKMETYRYIQGMLKENETIIKAGKKYLAKPIVEVESIGGQDSLLDEFNGKTKEVELLMEEIRECMIRKDHQTKIKRKLKKADEHAKDLLHIASNLRIRTSDRSKKEKITNILKDLEDNLDECAAEVTDHFESRSTVMSTIESVSTDASTVRKKAREAYKSQRLINNSQEIKDKDYGWEEVDLFPENVNPPNKGIMDKRAQTQRYVNELSRDIPNKSQRNAYEQEDVPTKQFVCTHDVSKHLPFKINLQSGLAVFTGEDYLKYRPWRAMFDSTVDVAPYAEADKLAVLHNYVSGKAKNQIKYLVDVKKGHYKKALGLLEKRYGDEHRIEQEMDAQLMKLTAPSRHDPDGESLTTFADEVEGIFSAWEDQVDLNPRFYIGHVIHKLNFHHAAEWRLKAAEYGYSLKGYHFTEWLTKLADSYRDFVHPHHLQKTNTFTPKQNNDKFKKNPTLVKTFTANVKNYKEKKHCPLCKMENHNLIDCFRFKGLSVKQRYDAIQECKEEKICYQCLQSKHLRQECPSSAVKCSKDGCNKPHHELLHYQRQLNTSSVPSGSTPNNFGPPQQIQSNAINIAMFSEDKEVAEENVKIALGMLEANVVTNTGRGTEKGVLFLDSGSTISLIKKDFAIKLGLSMGPEKEIDIQGVAGVNQKVKANWVQLQLQVNGKRYNVKALALEHMLGKLDIFDWSTRKHQYPHLRSLELASISEGVIEPDILIGSDHGIFHRSKQTLFGGENDPWAELTVLGWVVRGPTKDKYLTNGKRQMYSNYIKVNVLNAETFFESEKFGSEIEVKPQKDPVLLQIEEGIRKLTDDGYSVKLPWKNELCPHELQENNFEQAKQRLIGLERQLSKCEKDKMDYEAALEKYLDEGYAVEIGDATPKIIKEKGTHYLPHHGIRKKSTGKLRVVFDSSAKGAQNLSLNNRLNVGPKLQQELHGVLTAFREGELAFTSDIKAMFSRIRLDKEDAKLHRYLWRKNDDKITVYEMRRVTFGDAPSPCIAIRVTLKAAETYGLDMPLGKEVIEHHMFVDDVLVSKSKCDDAFEAARQVIKILKKADFSLEGWVTNNKEFVNCMKRENVTVEIKNTSVLGMRWDPAADVMRHAIPDTVQEEIISEVQSVEENSSLFTKRQLLSSLAEIFSPLGFAAPFIVAAKIKLKELHLKGYAWDDKLQEKDAEFWKHWLIRREEFCNIPFQRCLQPNKGKIMKTELHVFCDASELAFAAVSYVRTVYESEEIYSNILIAKTKVSPKKTITVAKLELNAALLGARIADNIKGLLRNIKINQRWFWTDSSCTRQWIRNESSQYKPFVANRIGEIQTLTEPEEWRYVPGKLNPADLGTRCSLIDKKQEMVDVFKIWQEGPEFLKENEANWPKDIRYDTNKEEMKNKLKVNAVQRQGPVIQWSKHSSFGRLVRAVARIIKLQKRVKHKSIGHNLNVDDIQIAESELARLAQAEMFSEELYDLEKGNEVCRSSRLLSLTPFLENNLLRVGGRIGGAPLPYDAKHPIILTKNHEWSKLIVKNYHQKSFHAGTNHLLSLVREKYWIINGRELCKKTIHDCFQCKKRRISPSIQIMSDLPISRFKMTPFKNISADIFGPFTVRLGAKRNRVEQKQKSGMA